MAVIDVRDVVKRYDGRAVVDDVSFVVEPGEIFAVLGPNGAGKTTLVEMIGGLRRPDAGRVRVFGADPRSDGGRVRERLGAQLQESRLPDRIRVWEALDLYSSFYRAPLPWPDLLETLGLTEVRDSRFADLSGGQKQRVSVALALVGDPEVAVLDELTTGLDPRARRDTWELVEAIRDRGVTIVLVTHFMDEAERLADRIAVLDRGRLVALDTPAGLVEAVAADQRIRLRPRDAFDDAVLVDLPEVTGVTNSGSDVVVTGTGNLLYAVATALARHDVVAEKFLLERRSLDDAYLALTGHEAGSDDGLEAADVDHR